MKGVTELLALNRGRISRHALARLDLKRQSMSAEVQTNFVPMDLGPMMLRPGLGHLDQIASTTHAMIPFVAATDDTAIVEVTVAALRFWVDDALVTSSAASASVTNGTFTSNITGWTDDDEGSAVSAWVTGGYMGLTGTGADSAIRHQQITVTDTGVEHRIAIVVERGPVRLRIGSTSSADDFFSETTLGAGAHSIAVTPSGNMYIQFLNRETRQALVDSVSIYAASTVVSLPWAVTVPTDLRYCQSADVIYVCDGADQQFKIERRTGNSWSVVKYEPLDGPFLPENTGPITIAASAITGSVTLTASKPLFRATNVGSLWRISSDGGQQVTENITAENTFTNSVRITGVSNARNVGIVITGTFTATVTLQRSFDDATWGDVGGAFQWSAPVTDTYDDELDNQIVYYRLGVKTGDFGSGTVVATLITESGSITGIVKITAYSSQTSATADVIEDLGGTAATSNWAEGAWSDRRGWPSAVALHDGRLFWAGNDKVWGSVTDAYESFDPDFEGDAGPISRSIGFGPVDRINWLLPLGRLAAGTAGSEVTFRSSSFDEPLTPTNFTPKETSTQGSATVAAVKVDGRGIFVQRSGARLYSLVYDITASDYIPEDLSQFIPDIGSPGIVKVAVQRQPDTRIHCVRSDGTVAMLLFNKAENIVCWVDIETVDGDEIQDVVVLPGEVEDAVYYSVKRAVGGVDYSWLEKWAMQSEARGAAVTKLGDGSVYAAGASTTLTGLGHLEGREVVLWGNGKDQGTATVSGGSVTFPESCTNRCAGLAYEARFKSAKLAYVVQPGKPGLGARKRIDAIGLVLADTHHDGLYFGRDFDTMDPLPATEAFAEVADDTIHTAYEGDLIEFGGEWGVDERLCLKAAAPKPCTVLAVVVEMEGNAK